MYATNYLETKILNLMRGVSVTAPTAVYLGLFLNNPGESGLGTEVSYAGYARLAVNFSEPAPMNGGIGIQNIGEMTFATAPTTIGTVTYIGVFDSLTGGNMLLYAELTEPLILGANEAPVIVAGEAEWWSTGQMSDAYKVKVLNLLRGISCSGFSPYLSLWNGDPEKGGAELSGGAYARVLLTFAAPAEQTSGQMMMKNSVRSATERATSAWGSWTHTVIYDAASNGTPAWSIPRSAPKEMRKGLLAVVEPGALSIVVN